jgi:hypothetical protein
MSVLRSLLVSQTKHLSGQVLMVCVKGVLEWIQCATNFFFSAELCMVNHFVINLMDKTVEITKLSDGNYYCIV